MAGSNCYKNLQLHNHNPDCVIDKYQTGVFSTTYDSPTDAVSDCLNVDHVRRLMSWRVSSWLLQVYTVG